jgi:hypothetical protein
LPRAQSRPGSSCRYAKSFGRPDFIYAPNPSIPKADAGEPYDYVRPLATVEPTAIFFKLPVDTSFGFSDIHDLQAALESHLASRAGVLIGSLGAQTNRGLGQGDPGRARRRPAVVPKWRGDDFDSIYIVTINAENGTALFALDHEGLDGMPASCPH